MMHKLSVARWDILNLVGMFTATVVISSCWLFIGAIQQTGGYFGEGSGPIHFDNVVCSGREYNLTDCQLKIGTRQSTHTEDVGVKCQTSKSNSSVSLYYFSLVLTVDSSYREGSIRLAGGAYNWEGRVEIYWMGEWGAVSSGHMPWTATEAEVVCRQLGHSNNDCESSACANQGQYNITKLAHTS